MLARLLDGPRSAGPACRIRLAGYSATMEFDRESTGDSASRRGGIGTAFGCLAAFFLLSSVGVVVTVGTMLGDCMPGVDCHRDDQAHLAIAAVVVLLLAVLFGLAVRSIANWFRWTHLEGCRDARLPIWAFILAVPLAFIAVLCALVLVPIFAA